MPELPEVENARRILARAGLPGRTFTGIQVGWANSLKSPSLEDFVLGLLSRRIVAVERRGKYLLLPLDSGETFILHLGMTGGVNVWPAGQHPDPMVRHTFALDDGRELRFRDPRKFGHLWLTAEPEQTLPNLGPEPLSPQFTPDALAEKLAGRSASVKALLLEQSVAAGLGNLYVDEALYQAGINPHRSGADLTAADLVRLRDCVVAALQAAIAQYDRARDEEWPDPPSALHTWTLPRKAGEPCPNCGGPIAGARIRARGTFFCPACQPTV